MVHVKSFVVYTFFGFALYFNYNLTAIFDDNIKLKGFLFENYDSFLDFILTFSEFYVEFTFAFDF